MPNIISRALAAPILVASAMLGVCPSLAVAAGSLKAAYVEEVIPARTYSAELILSGSPKFAEPAAGILGLTSITLSSNSPSATFVSLFFAVTSGPNCTGTVSTLGKQFSVLIQPKTAVHFPFPSPMVLGVPTGGEPTCLYMNGGSDFAVFVHLNGVIN